MYHKAAEKNGSLTVQEWVERNIQKRLETAKRVEA